MPRKGRSTGRLPGVRRTDRQRRPAREESCGGHFREEHQTADGEAQRHDDNFAHVAAWEYNGDGGTPDPPQGRPRLRVRRAEAAELQVRTDTEDLAPGRRRGHGRVRNYELHGISPDMSFLEMLDVLNEQLLDEGDGAGRVRPRLPRRDLRHVRRDDQRAGARPGRDDDLPVAHAALSPTATRSSSSRGGPGVPHRSGSRRQPLGIRPHHPEGRLRLRQHRRRPGRHSKPVPKANAERAFDAADCIGCGACVAACQNASAMLFMGAKVTHLAQLPQGEPERDAAW